MCVVEQLGFADISRDKHSANIKISAKGTTPTDFQQQALGGSGKVRHLHDEIGRINVILRDQSHSRCGDVFGDQ